MNETKMLSFEEWKERFAFKNLPVTIGVHNHMLEGWFESARQGTIPADRAVEIPEVWPEDAVCVLVGFSRNTPEVVKTFTSLSQVIHVIPRPTPAWTPRVGEAVFYKNTCSVTTVKDGFTGDGLVSTNHFGFVHPEDLKPFSESAIGKEWSQI